MQRIIENLSRQHRELVRTGTDMFGWLDPAKLRARGAADVYRALSSLSGILRVHLAMEDASFYPHLVDHSDAELRMLARRFLDERAQMRDLYEGYKSRWPSSAAIEREPERFVDETRAILGMLWNRMKMEDDVLHPVIARVFAA